MAQQLKSTIRHPAKTKPVMVKMSPEEFALIYGKSKKWARGNISEFLREAGKNWIPSKEDLIEISDEAGA